MKSIFGKLRLLGVLLFVFTSVVAYGQKADDYFSEGKELKARKKYQDAITKFNSAKSLYSVAKKTAMVKSCNLEISECRKLIGYKPKPNPKPNKNDSQKVEAQVQGSQRQDGVGHLHQMQQRLCRRDAGSRADGPHHAPCDGASRPRCRERADA